MTDENTVPPAPSPRQSNYNADIMSHPANNASHLVAHAVDSEDSRPIRCAKFRQQELWAWKPVWSPSVIVTMYFIVAVVFIPLGIALLVQSSSLFSSPLRRYDGGACQVGNQTSADAPPKQCTIRLQIDKNISAPAYFYYGITNYYQNARTYVSSRSDGQLRGEENPSTGECEPLEFNQTTGEVLNPCGLIANSQFNDSFTLCRDLGCNDEVTLNGTGIAWNIDRETRFVNRSEDFMVWMRVAAYRNWKKLYRKIEDDLEEGTYYIRVNSSYPVSGFGGKKFFYISETSWFGGPNLPLALAYIIVGSVSLLIAIFFGIYSRNTRDLELPPTSTVYLEGMVKNPIQQQHTDHMHQQHTTSV